MKIFYMRRAMALLAALRHERILPAPNRAGTTSARVHRRKQNSQSLRVLEVLGRVMLCYCVARAIGEEICNCISIGTIYTDKLASIYTLWDLLEICENTLVYLLKCSSIQQHEQTTTNAHAQNTTRALVGSSKYIVLAGRDN